MTAPDEPEMNDAEMLRYVAEILGRGSTPLAEYLRGYLAALIRSTKDVAGITK